MAEGELARRPVRTILQRQEREVALKPCRVLFSPGSP